MEAVFHMTFYDPNSVEEHPFRSLGFYIDNIDSWYDLLYNLDPWLKKFDQTYAEHSLDIKPAGVCANGYITYDLDDHAMQDELMEQWRRAFLSESPGSTVSDVFAADMEHMNDAQILEAIKQSHEHQQAQILRDTLNTHIRGSKSVAPSKKI